MKIIKYSEIVEYISETCIRAATAVSSDILENIENAYNEETFPRAKKILGQIIDNAHIARREGVPVCQDTGYAVYFVEIGDNVKIEGGTLHDAINEGTAKGYTEGNLRASIVDDPLFDRQNTNDNTPAIIHYDITPGDHLEITLLLKGGGCENVSALAMLKPSDGLLGMKKFVTETVINSGGNACPPLSVGVGIGGTADMAGILAKKALLRPAGIRNRDGRYAQLEKDLLEEINASGIGPQGLGGKHTALNVAIEYMPCHIASLPVAVNINCHAARSLNFIFSVGCNDDDDDDDDTYDIDDGDDDDDIYDIDDDYDK